MTTKQYSIPIFLYGLLDEYLFTPEHIFSLSLPYRTVEATVASPTLFEREGLQSETSPLGATKSYTLYL